MGQSNKGKYGRRYAGNSALHGYPHAFSEQSEWENEEEYNAAVASGERVGGEMEAWLKALDEMIFDFEYVLFHEIIETKKGRNFCLKYYGETQWYKVEKNKHFSCHYYMKNPEPGLSRWMSTGKLLSNEECQEKCYELRHTMEYYHN